VAIIQNDCLFSRPGVVAEPLSQVARLLLMAVLMSLTNQKPGPTYDAQSAEIGNVATLLNGVTYVGFYRVGAGGRGRQRFNVTADKTVTVDYHGRVKYTCIGMRGLQLTAEALLSELVTASRSVPLQARA
jgi:hypothetical protein